VWRADVDKMLDAINVSKYIAVVFDGYGQKEPQMAKAQRVPWTSRIGYDAERDLGLVAFDASDTVAEDNCDKLNAALEAQWHGGEFTFADGTNGPILNAIVFSAKTFYFKGEIKTTIRGGNSLIGGGGRGFVRGDEEFGTAAGNNGGAVTRFVRLDGAAGGAVLRLKGSGMYCTNIDFHGRASGDNPNKGTKTITGASNATPIVITTSSPHGYSNGQLVTVFGVNGNDSADGTWAIDNVTSTTFELEDSAGSGTYAGGGTVADPMCTYGILVEGRESGGPLGASVSTGKHVFINYGVFGCQHGIAFLSGYDDGAGLVETFAHADESLWLDGRILGCFTAVWSNNDQAVVHTFLRLSVNATGAVPVNYVFDAQRGGLWKVSDLQLSPTPMTVLRVWSVQGDAHGQHYSPNSARFEIHFYRDGGGDPGQIFRLFEYFALSSGGVWPDASFRKWDIRFSGSIADAGATKYDSRYIVKLKDNSTSSDPVHYVPCTNIWFDVFNLPMNQDFDGTPLEGFTWETVGPWSRLVAPTP
jgi:hypothetical protein